MILEEAPEVAAAMTTPDFTETDNLKQSFSSPQDYLKFRLNASLAGQPIKTAEVAWPEKMAHERHLRQLAQ